MRINIRRICLFAGIALGVPSAHAEGEVLEALAGLVKIDNGTYKTVVLLPGQGQVANYCGESWSWGFIREGATDPESHNAKISLPGCWGGIGDPESRNFEFRYMIPARAGVSSFSINIDELKRLKYDTDSDEIIPD